MVLEFEMKEYRFYGADTPPVNPNAERAAESGGRFDPSFAKIKDQRDLYSLLFDLWTERTCAPRLRGNWSEEDRTLGQCSITAFLVQDIFGGRVFGVPLPSGGVHCYNEVSGVCFDLTSEQFKGEKLSYDRNFPQQREEHFADEDKKSRYELLRAGLLNKLNG